MAPMSPHVPESFEEEQAGIRERATPTQSDRSDNLKFTTLHTNSLIVLGTGTLAAMVMAVLNHECLGGNIFAGAIGLALVFAKIKENGNGV